MVTIGVSTMGAGGGSAPPRRIKSNLGGKEFGKGMPFIQENSKKGGFKFSTLDLYE